MLGVWSYSAYVINLGLRKSLATNHEITNNSQDHIASSTGMGVEEIGDIKEVFGFT